MIQYLTLSAAEPMLYRSREGGAVKLRFDRPEGPVFSYIHKATEEQATEWKCKVGQLFAVRIATVSLRPGEAYHSARLVERINDRR